MMAQPASSASLRMVREIGAPRPMMMHPAFISIEHSWDSYRLPRITM